MVGGWDLVQNYDSPSASESSSSEEDELAAAALAGGRARRGSSHTSQEEDLQGRVEDCLEALAAETDDDEMQKRLKKKEYKII